MWILELDSQGLILNKLAREYYLSKKGVKSDSRKSIEK